MKKITLFIALLMAVGFNANALNNPKDANGNMIFKWDCSNDRFATSNDFEIDETVVFAVDVTGTPLEAWLAAAAPAGQTRSIAFDFATGWGGGGCDGRFIKIKGNIYGATLNFAQLITSRQNQLKLLNVGGTGPSALTVGTITYFTSNIFGFAFTSTEPGADWWQLPLQGDAGAIFTTAAYTGTNTSIEFYKDDTDDSNFFPGAFTDWMGYAAPCADIQTDVKTPSVSDSPVVGYEFYNLLGGKLKVQPQSGIFIEKAIKEDGSSVTRKVFNNLK